MSNSFPPDVAPDGVTVPWRRALRATVALWLFVLLIFMPLIVRRHGAHAWGSILLDACTIVSSMGLGLALFALFRATLDWPRGGRVAAMAAGVLTASAANATFDIAYTGWVANNIDASWANVPQTLARAYGALFNYIMVFGVNVALFQLALVRRRMWVQARRLAEAQSSAQQAEIAALRFQIDPHFLFNSLNAISAMIVAGRNDEAEELTGRLSTFLRGSTDFDPLTPITLDEELCGIGDYLEIEQVRFGNRLSCAVDCSREAGTRQVPARILQPIVARLIEKAMPTVRDCLELSVAASVERSALIIDVGARTDADPLGGCGEMALVTARLAAFYGDRAALSVRSEGGRIVARIAIAGDAA